MRFYLGIDVAKLKLDCALLDTQTGKRKTKSVENTTAGVASLLAWCAKQNAAIEQIHVLIEPTGVYHEAAALALTDASVQLSLVNSFHLRRFAESLGVMSKNDATDAAMLARFGQERRPEPWQPPSPRVRQLQALLARREAIATDLQREQNRLGQAQLGHAPSAVLDSIHLGIAHLTAQLQQLDRVINQHIDSDPDLRNTHRLLQTIPGVGDRVATRFTALLADHRFTCAEQLAAYLGLVPVEWSSGTSVHAPARLSKKGPSLVRRLLFMPAVVAKRCNPHVKAVYERLLARGKSPMASIAAAMRKLVHLCFGVVHSGQPYSPTWTTNQA